LTSEAYLDGAHTFHCLVVKSAKFIRGAVNHPVPVNIQANFTQLNPDPRISRAKSAQHVGYKTVDPAQVC
jgi:hypothetical protein